MKTKNNLIFALLGGFSLLTAGCVKESDMNEKYRPEGTPIIFSAATGYENGDGTRTEYSGHFFNGSTEVTGNTLSSYANTWERIDWLQNDPLVIYYDRASASADYAVTSSIDANAEISDAGIEVASGSSKLTWAGGSGNHVFMAMYPKNGFGNNSSIIFNGANGQVGGLIPATQTLRTVSGKYLPQMQYAYMVARKTIDGSSTQHTVALPFKPAFTAFEFRLRRPATLGNGSTASFKVKSFTISSTSPLAGNFNLTIDGEDSRGATWSATPTVTNNGNKSNSVTVTFNGNTGVDLSTSADLDFTLLTLPTPIADLTLTLTFADAGNTTKSITLKDSNNQPKSFVPCKKYIITNSNAGFDDWEYVLEEIDDITTYGHNPVPGLGFNVMSYKKSKANPSIKQPVAWHIEYKQPGGSYSTTNPNAAFAMSSGSSTTGTGSYTTGEDRSVDIVTVNNNHHTEGTGAGIAARAKLASATPKSMDPNNPYDLSLYDVHGVSHARTTANSYVVSAPGYYKFPVVYGNAITNNNDNKSAYDPYGTGAPADLVSMWSTQWNKNGVYLTPKFRNALNEPITSPYVLTDVASHISNPEVVIVWQDTEAGDEIIKYGAEDLKLVGTGNSAYIQFYIDKENIHQGNVLIGLRASLHDIPYGRTEGVTVGGGTAYNPAKNIIWSWQIWVSERDLTPITSRNLMPVNLGWVDRSTSSVDKYTDRQNDYRIVQDEPGALTEDFKILQIGDSREIASNAGGNPYYEWGRKDPITPQSGHRTTQAYTDELNAAGPTYVWTYINSLPFFTATYQYEPYHQSDYGRMIRQPWLPLADPITHSPINGQFYPPTDFAHTHLDNGSLTNWNEINANQHMHTGDGDANQRQLASCVFNLWNSSVYESGDFGGADKYKTVYDPCPPGFCVPSLGTFDGFESASFTDVQDEGLNITIGGETVFMAYSGARVFQGIPGAGNTYEVDSYAAKGFYWTDSPSAVEHSTSFSNPGFENHAGGYFYFQFAKSLRFDSGQITYSPEDNHWGSEPQTQRTGFDDVRANAFSIRPIVDPKY